MNPIIIYCYDAYCGWCYGFSANTMKQINAAYGNKMHIEVLNGGLVNYGSPQPISMFSDIILSGYKRIEELSGVKFGEDFLWHVNNTDKSDWFLDSEKAAVAMCIFKEIYSEKQVEFAADLQYAFNYEARDLMDDEAYRHLLEKYSIEPETFYTKLHSEEYKQKALAEFSLCSRMGITGYPCLLLQLSENKIYMIAQGFDTFENVDKRIKNILEENKITL